MHRYDPIQVFEYRALHNSQYRYRYEYSLR